MPPAARITDPHQCPLTTPVGPVPVMHVGGPILPPGAVTVLIGGLPAATVGTLALCAVPLPPDMVVKGSMTAHGGTIVTGYPTVMIGG